MDDEDCDWEYDEYDDWDAFGGYDDDYSDEREFAEWPDY